MSLDGRFATPDGALDWQTLGPAHAAYSVDLLDEVDTLVFGRRTYDLMRAFWPTDQGARHSPEIAARMNGHLKLVASRRALTGAWVNARRVDGDLVDVIRDLKSRPGKDIAVLGSRSVLAQLSDAGLVDEVRITLNPVILAAGPPLFGQHAVPHNLELVASRALDGGAMLLVYRPR
jgi:dihydrofolate reductase